MFFLERIDEVIHNSLIKVVAAQTVVAGGCKNFDHAVADFENRDIERAAAEVVNKYFLVGVLGFVKTVSKRRRSRFVDDTLYVKTRDTTCVLGSLTLSVGEVRRNGDDRFGDFRAEVALSVRFKF